MPVHDRTNDDDQIRISTITLHPCDQKLLYAACNNTAEWIAFLSNQVFFAIKYK